MSLKHAILGFLSFRSLTGYELKKAFDQSVNHFWPADQSQIYRTLKQLHQDSLVSMKVIPQEERLDMKVYEVTDEGKRELQTWLASPPPPETVRDPFLIKVYFAFMLEDEKVLELLQAEIRHIDDLLEEYESVYELALEQKEGQERSRPIFYSMLTLEFGIKANQWYRSWLKGVMKHIEAKDFSSSSREELFG